MIDSDSDHFIVCGYGRVGRQVARDLRPGRARAYVVIDLNPATAGRRAGRRSAPASRAQRRRRRGAGGGGDRAGAAAVIACVDSDAENIFITLSARELRSDILIIARASAEDSEKKLLRAGADRVISPYKTSGSEMARIALHPQVGGVARGGRLPDGGDRGPAGLRGRRADDRGGPRRRR